MALEHLSQKQRLFGMIQFLRCWNMEFHGGTKPSDSDAGVWYKSYNSPVGDLGEVELEL